MEPQLLMNNPNAKPFEETQITPLEEDDFTTEYYKLKKGRRWLPQHGWKIEEGDIKQIPKRELKVVPELYERVYDYKAPENEKKYHEVATGGKIETAVIAGPKSTTSTSADIFQLHDIDVDKLLKGDSDEELKIKALNVEPNEIKTMVCNVTGKAFDDRRLFFEHKLKLYNKAKTK